MSGDIEKRVEKLFLLEKPLLSRKQEVFQAKDIVYFTAEGGQPVAITENGSKYELVQNLNFFENEYKEYFLRVHRSFLVAADRIDGVFRRFPTGPIIGLSKAQAEAREESELQLRGTETRIPVSLSYAEKLRKLFGIKSLRYLTPEHPDDKKLRTMGLIDCGHRELFSLAANDKKAVEIFKKKWDIKQFSKTLMLSCFRQVETNQIDTKRVIKNIIYQMFRWIKKGIEPPSDGNIRSLWYRIKAVLAYHSNILGPGDVDTFYNTLQEMVEDMNLFRYKDFGFMDMNEPYRGIGDKKPEIILASEKIGHFFFIKKLAAEIGVSFICLKGEPAVLSLEYFSDDLMKICGDKEKTVFCISDVDPSGYSIERNLVGGLQRNGHQVGRVVKLVDPSIFTTEEIGIIRYPVVNYEEKGTAIKPVKPAKMSQVTKSRDWFKQLADNRLYSEKDKGDGWKAVTIWGIESDAADRDVIKKRFLEGLEPKRRKPEPEKKTEKKPENTIRLQMWLEVENNNKFVRGRKTSLERIERYLEQYYNARKLHKDGMEYELTVTYTDDADLDRTVYEIVGEIDGIADLRHCCIECDLWAVDDPDRRW
ncbi:MAG: LytTR family DNA-binding domain-containing protein [bacterium]|nr:LytTR family DNA-binding domain-containing protein [bacterium]